MGRRMVALLKEAGYDVVVYDASEAAAGMAAEMGGIVAESISEVTGSVDRILLSLPGPAQVEAVMTGPGGLLENPPVGGIVVDTTTSRPETTERMAFLAREKGFDFIDAPVLGRPGGAGQWVFPVGGDASCLPRVEDCLGVLGKKAVHIPGGPGAGHKLKLLNQLLFTVTNAVTCEMMAIVGKSGLEPADVFNTIRGSGAATVSGLFSESAGKIVEGDFDPLFPVDLLRKDAGLAIEMAKSFGASPLLAELSQTMNNIASDQGFGGEDSSALFKTYRSLYTRSEEK